jgi:hypothetical protein
MGAFGAINESVYLAIIPGSGLASKVITIIIQNLNLLLKNEYIVNLGYIFIITVFL